MTKGISTTNHIFGTREGARSPGAPPALNPVERKNNFKIGLTSYLAGPEAGSLFSGLNMNLNQLLKRMFILGLHCHAIKNKNANHSIQKD